MRAEAAPAPIRIRKHPHAVDKMKIVALFNSPDVAEDRPCGHVYMRTMLLNQKMGGADALKKEPGWENLKFVFPAARSKLNNNFVFYIRWDNNLKVFMGHQGGILIDWRESFRTVHEN